MKNTQWIGPKPGEMAAAFVEAFAAAPAPAPAGIKTYYRGWRIEATPTGSISTKGDEEFIARQQPGIREALRRAKRRVDRLENGPS